MGHRVSPRWQAPIGPEEVSVAGLEPDLIAVSDWLPLDRGVEAPGQRLEHFAAGHAEQEGLVGGGEVLAEAALESDHGFGSGYDLHSPLGRFGGSVSVLSDRLFVFFGHKVLVVVAAEAHRLCVVKEVHSDSELVRIGLREKSNIEIEEKKSQNSIWKDILRNWFELLSDSDKCFQLIYLY